MRPKWAGGPANRPDGPLQSLRRRVWAARVFALSVPDAFEKHFFNGLLDKALAELGTDRAGVRERHRRITEKHGASTADTVFRIFRAVYNRGLREHPELPANPTANVDYHGLLREEEVPEEVAA